MSRAVRTEHRPRAGGPEGIPGRRPKDRPKTLGIGTKSPHRGLSECLRFYSYGGVLVVFCTCAKSDKQYVVHSFVRTAVRFSSHFRFLHLFTVAASEARACGQHFQLFPPHPPVSRAVRTEHRPRAGGPEGIPGRRPKDRPKTLGIGTKSPHRGLSECLRFYSYGGVLVAVRSGAG